jgi:hypothetical protein
MGFASYDVHNDYRTVKAILPATHTTAQTGITVDTAAATGGDRTKTVTFVVAVGVITDGTIDFTVEESDASGSGFAAIASSRVFGSLSPAFTSSTDETTHSITVKPAKRYVRINTVETVASTGYALSAVALLRTF